MGRQLLGAEEDHKHCHSHNTCLPSDGYFEPAEADEIAEVVENAAVSGLAAIQTWTVLRLQEYLAGISAAETK